MSLTRAKPAGWGTNDPFTSAQANAMDINISNAVDGRVGALEIPSRTITRAQPLTPMLGAAAGTMDLPTDWFFYDTALGWIQATTGSVLYFPLSNLIDLATLTKVRAILKGGAGPGGNYSALPSVMPTLKVEYVDTGGPVVAPTPTKTDPATPVAGFNVAHAVEVVLDTPIVIDQTILPRMFYARLDGVGTGFEANKLAIIKLECDFTVTRLAPGG